MLAGLAIKPLKAQIDTAALIDAYLTSDYIFEGVVIEQCYYDDPQTGNIYTSNRVQITKIFKGEIVCGTVNIITPGGILNGYEVHVSHQTEFNVGVAGVFLCKNTPYPIPTCGATADNPAPVELTQAFQGTIEYLFDYVNAQVEGFNSQFPTIQSFYEFLTLNGINIIYCNGALIEELQSKAKSRQLPKASLEPLLQRTPTSYSLDRVFPKSRQSEFASILQKKPNSGLGKKSTDLQFLISNISLSGTGCTKEYVIEISIKSNVGSTYLEGAVFQLQYNSACMGTNVFSSVSFTRTSDFPASNYDFVGGFDENSNTIQVSVQYTFTTPNRIQVTTSPKRLLVVRIPVTNCKVLGNFVMPPIAFNPLTWYGTSQTGSSTFQYDNVTYGATAQGNVCDPIISSLSSTSLNAGRGEILTIDGCNFGNDKGNISMNNADGSPTSIALDKYDITQWTDNQIKIKIPSQVDSGNFDGTTYKKHPVGSGPITITTTYGGSEITSTVTIKSAVFNRSQVYSPGGFAKTNQFLFSANQDGKYHFKLHPNITDPEMIDCIKAAIRRWRCTTHVPFVLDAGTTTANADDDGVNIIKLTALGTSATTLAQTWTRTVYTCSASPTIPYPVKEIDIEINSDKLNKFQYDTTGYEDLKQDSFDFFTIILHELGHGLCLTHTLNVADIMYPTAPKGFRTATNRAIILKNNDLDGANYVINNSTTTPSGMTCAQNLPIQLQTAPCGWNNGFEEANATSKITVYPNPFNNSLRVSFNSVNTEKIRIRIINILGEEVYLSDFEQFKIEKNIELGSSLKNGVYFMLIEGETFSVSQKIICSK